MFSDLSEDTSTQLLHYPRLDSGLDFDKYISECRTMIAERREDLQQHNAADQHKIIEANSPFEYPNKNPSSSKPRIGALLIHGLLDSPFTWRELASHLQDKGIATQAVLLQGHGTRPSDLLHVKYEEWLQTVRYSIQIMRQKVDKLFLIGYSTGAALALVNTLSDTKIEGLILLAPAIKLRLGIDVVVNWIQLTNLVLPDREWIYKLPETDYVKYKSIALNGAIQVAKLTDIVREKENRRAIKQPIFMILSKEDETVSSPDAVKYFRHTSNDQSQLLIYSGKKKKYKDPRITVRHAAYPEININHLSHAAMLFSKNNMHYGERGNYTLASHTGTKDIIDGAYSRIEVKSSELMAKYNLVKNPKRALTYNPDFPQLVDDITQFITTISDL